MIPTLGSAGVKLCDSTMAQPKPRPDDWRGDHHTRTMKALFNTAGGLATMLAIYIAFFFCISSTLTDMTKADCTRGIQRACAELERTK